MQNSTPIPWLLTARTSSIRYLTLRRLLGRPEDDADVRAARQAMAASRLLVTATGSCYTPTMKRQR
jgi:hypothetical protein